MVKEKELENMNAGQLIDALKSKNKKIRYKSLEAILKLSRSHKTAQKQEFLGLVLLKSKSEDWEERYAAMYAISRFYRKNWNIKEFKQQFLNVLRLVEDKDGRVRIAARNALEHFRSSFLLFCFGEWETNEKELVNLWRDSLFLLGDKIEALEEGKMQLHILECIKILCRNYMDEYLNKKDYERYNQIWERVNELDNLHYEYGP